ncbi:MAG: hypothetical protein Q8O40_12035 [Chloroflexota bacterium]|nr:hypothetical protein [Chloroflexota bacterium]
MEEDAKVLVVRRIHVSYRLVVDREKREAAERAHGVHARACPMARTIGGCVEVTTSLEMVDASG